MCSDRFAFPASVALAVLGLLAVACSHATPTASPSTTSRPSTTSTAAPTGPGGVTTVPGGSGVAPTSSTLAPPANSPVTRAVTTCATAGLTAALDNLGAAAGTDYQELVFTNTSSQGCAMEGFPGLSFVDARGVQIGAAALRMSGPGGSVTVAPGATAVALIAYHDAYVSTFPTCQPTKAAAVRVYPPDQSAFLTVPVPGILLVCANPAATGTAAISPVSTPANIHS